MSLGCILVGALVGLIVALCVLAVKNGRSGGYGF